MTLKDLTDEQVHRVIELDEKFTASEPRDTETGIVIGQMGAANRASRPAKKKLADFIDGLKPAERQELLALFLYGGQSSEGITSFRKVARIRKDLQTSDYLVGKPLAATLRDALNKRQRSKGWS
jgi:hypothetical protein